MTTLKDFIESKPTESVELEFDSNGYVDPILRRPETKKDLEDWESI